MPPTLFGNPSRGELEQQNAQLQAELDHARQALDQSRGYVLKLDEQLNKARRIGPIVDALQAELQRREDSGEITFAAEEVARAAVLDSLTRERTEGISQKILHDRRRQLEAKYGPDWTRQQRVKLTEMFEQDGTFAKLDEEVQVEVHHKTAAEVREAERLKILAKYTTPEAAAKGKEAALKALIASGEAQKIEAAIREMHEADWREAAVEDVKRLYADQLEDTRATYMTSFGEEWLASYEGRQFQARARQEAENKWERLSIEEKRSSVLHLIDKELLEEMARLEAERIKRDNAKEAARQLHEQLFGDFERLGIDMQAIPMGSSVTLMCGEQRRAVHPNYAGYSYHKEYERDLFISDRVVVLTSRGDGTFIVVSDSLSQSGNRAEQAMSMPEQHVMTVGYKVTETVNGSSEPTLLTRIRCGVEFAYDDDPATPQDIQPGLFPVANVIIDGTSFLKLDQENIIPRSKMLE